MRSLASDIAIVLLLLFVALGFRAPCMNGSLWLDELHTGWTVSQSLDDVAPRARMGNNLPLYFYLVRVVTGKLGESEFALRLPSLLAGLVAIATSYLLVRRWSGSISAAIATSVIMMIDPHFLFYSVEARPYALIQWLGLIQVAAFLAWMQAGTLTTDDHPPISAGLVWFVTTTLLFYLHCTSVLLPLAQLPLAVLFARSSTSRFRFTVAWIAFLGLTLFAAPTLFEIYSHRKAWNEFIPMPSITGLLTLFPIAYMLVPAAAAWFVGIKFKRDPDIGAATEEIRPAELDPRRLILIGLMFALPLLIAFFLTQTDIARLFLRRYLIVVSGLPILIAGLFIGHVRMKSLRYGAALLTMLAVIWAGPYTQWHRDGRIVQRSREDWRSAVELLNEQSQPGDVVFIASDLIESDRLHDAKETANPEFISYCALPLTGLYRLRNDVTVIPIPMTNPDRFTATSADGQVAATKWIVSRRFDKERLDSLVPAGASVREHRKRSPTIIEIKP